jgi:hypothetical protein
VGPPGECGKNFDVTERQSRRPVIKKIRVVVLRMLALKHLRDWSHDDLEREVTGRLVYHRFCRIDAA